MLSFVFDLCFSKSLEDQIITFTVISGIQDLCVTSDCHKVTIIYNQFSKIRDINKSAMHTSWNTAHMQIFTSKPAYHSGSSLGSRSLCGFIVVTVLSFNCKINVQVLFP